MNTVSKVSRALAAAALATAGLFAGASAASAHTTTVDAVIQVNGEWKAYATLNTGTGILCVRAYHSVPGATAYASVVAGNGQHGAVLDRGGDSDRSCTQLYGYYHGQYATLFVEFINSAGQQTVKNVGFYY
ncbi:hypothetical protein ASD16_14360 [Cellulomonas sp. Root485]|uniref:hypothetical protein n=1 Tax=Cellulomonas sp. Root485 TaxID=1736546 RepID=UPI0006F38BFD|nr:hypothetical protein [Cellulomonas sp. Root485]KQY21858.1 hypothetical protein ASD16_14360 [Cellulomonas sp. Root485]